MSNHYWGRDDGAYEENSLEAHRDFMVAPDGTYGHPSIDQGPRHLGEGTIDRARAALTFGPRDHRFANLVARFNNFMR